MRIAVLTAAEPLYLPAFIDRFLEARAADVAGVAVCPPLYRDQTTWTMLQRYVRAFGVANAARLALRVAWAKVRDLLRMGYAKRRFASVEAAARHHGVALWHPTDANAPEFLEMLRAEGVDLILSVSCPQIFKEELIALPAKGCLNLHGADLPEYRGILPSFWMMACGETEAAVSCFFVNAGIDLGDVAGRRRYRIEPDETLHAFILRSKREACDLALEVIDEIERGTVERRPLEGKGSYFGFPTREAYREFRRRGRKLW